MQKEQKKYDALNGDHSAKSWLKIMWKNFYIQLVILAIAFVVAILIERTTFESTAGFLFVLAIPVAVIVLITWLGFIKFWNELKGSTKDRI